MSKSSDFLAIAGVVLVVGAVGALLSSNIWWPAKDRAARSLDNYSFTEVKLDRTLLGLGCGKDDGIHYKFTALNSKGHKVNGVVCMDKFKAATVRVN